MTDELRIHGRVIDTNTELSIIGERGRFTFRHINPDGSLACYGGQTGRERWRDFPIARVKTVHIKPKNRKNKEPQ